MKVSTLAGRIADEINEPISTVSKVFKALNRWSGGTLYRFIRAAANITAILVCVCLAGCVSTTPAFGGKTRAETSFIDVDGTNYTRNVELPAGVALEGQDAMSLSIDADGAYKLDIGQSGKGDSTSQASMLTQVAQIQTDAYLAGWNSGLTMIGTAIQQALPFLGQYLEGSFAQAGLDSQQRASVQNAFMEWLKTLPIPTGQQTTTPNIPMLPTE